VIGPQCRLIEFVEIPSDPIPLHIDEAAQPLCYQDPLTCGRRRSERRALKLSDVLTRRQIRKLDFYWSVWKPLGIEDSLRLWLPAPCGRARMIYLERGRRTFTERDRSEIAAILVVSPHTVRKHIEHILEKLDVRTRSAAVARAFPSLSRIA
jgi:hypothetical protein